MKTLDEKLSKRIIELDVIRAIAVFFMIFDHIFYDLMALLPSFFKDYPFDLYLIGYKYWNWDFREIFRYVILFIFLAISGICCSFSKSNLKRGIKLLGIAMLLTMGTYIVGDIIKDEELTITFGILHCISLSLILVGLFEKLKVSKWFYLIVGLLMVSIGIYFYSQPEYCYLGKCYISYQKDPIELAILKQIIGIKKYGSDSFPLLINGGQIFIGVFLGKLIYKNKVSLFKNAKYKNNFITLVGRNSLIIYFAHQIILPILIGIILLICGYSLNI